MQSPTFLLLIIAMLSFTACSTSRSAANKKKQRTSTYVLKQIEQQKIQADWFSARVKVNYDDGQQNVSGAATVKMKKDSYVWMSVKKFGLELARLQVTQDSVYVLDRINREYSVEGLDYLTSSYGLPASLSGLQDFMLGNAVFFDQSDFEMEALGPTYQLSASDPKLSSKYWIDAASFFVRKMSLDDIENEQKVIVLLDEFGPANDEQNFSYLRTLDLNGKALGKMNIEMKFSKVEINIPNEAKFDIPSKYTRAK